MKSQHFKSEKTIQKISFKRDILIIGNAQVGKSSILNQYVHKIFKLDTSQTFIDFKTKQVSINNNRISLNLWDTAGQEKFRTMTTSQFKKAHAAILVFDLNNKQSLQDINFWIKELIDKTYQNLPKILIGNKCDLQTEVDKNDIKKISEQYDMKYFKCSAKKNKNIDRSFNHLSQLILKDFQNQNTNESFNLVERYSIQQINQKKYCCQKQ